MILKDIAEKLEDESVGTVGTDIFIGEIPQDVDNALMLVAGVSGEQDPYVSQVRQYDVEIWGRNVNAKNGYDKIKEALEVLHTSYNYSIEDSYVYLTKAISNIQDLDKDNNGRKLYKITIRVIYRELIS